MNTDGYAVLENFLTEKETENLKKAARELIEKMPDEKNRTIFSTSDSESRQVKTHASYFAAKLKHRRLFQNKDTYFLDSADKISYFFEEKALGENGQLLVDPSISLNKIGHALHELNETFRKATLDYRVKEVCFQLGYEDPAIVQSMYIFKNPGIGGEGKISK